MHDLDAIIKHAGVKGMKWGVRKAGKAVKTRVKEVGVRPSKKSIKWILKIFNVHSNEFFSKMI